MTQRSNSVDIRDLQDIQTPFGVCLSGIYKRSFAYITIKDRLPVILTKIIDTLSRNKENIAEIYGEDATEEIKQITGFISKLKNEIATNKTLKPLQLLPDSKDNDAEEWNKYLIKRTEIEEGTPTWFNTSWLYCECYMYRALAQEFALLKSMKSYDPFEQQKQSAFTNSLASIEALSTYTVNLIHKIGNLSIVETKDELFKLLKSNLWGNKCDLSLSAGAEVSQSTNPIEVLKSLDKDILVNNLEFVWNLLRNKDSDDTNIVDIILDNAGYELFTDLCLAAFLIASKLARKIRFYVKRYPWYISDTTANDFHWILTYMENSPNESIQELANYLKNNVWSIEVELYWTSPYDFAEMKKRDSKLYAKLSEAKLAIFKGDLNYRKLLGDINWEYTTEFRQSLRGFHPTNILSLRTVKSDVCVGLVPGVAEELFKEDESWMFTGQYGLIQTTIAGTCQCPNKTC
ncbi:damage-control phosphatase ARMT1-like [Bombus pyrosoma]|uniref:damage-control phosphatase ARMT1-like n=1 Tax=Bombus pyrosoma TaxID=396416 RepID=UPI001CB98111|nr:damage-control phosphatase ARMT1-like [Bombus pyrosoma]